VAAPGTRAAAIMVWTATPVGRQAGRRCLFPAMTELPDPRLLGRWRLFRSAPGLDFAPNVRMEFQPGGRLQYSFTAGENPQTVMLIYRVEGDLLLTDNPVAPHATTSKFWFGPGDVLAIDFAGAVAFFIREL
jgi:hypothetical protein